ILELIRSARGEFTGTTKLYKAFYFSHLFYADGNAGYLTEWPIVRMPNGPGIEAGNDLLDELCSSGFLTRDSVPIGPYKATRYHLTGKEWPRMPKEAQEAIEQAANFVNEKTATELSDLTHEFSRSWKKASDGQRLNCYI